MRLARWPLWTLAMMVPLGLLLTGCSGDPPGAGDDTPQTSDLGVDGPLAPAVDLLGGHHDALDTDGAPGTQDGGPRPDGVRDRGLRPDGARDQSPRPDADPNHVSVGARYFAGYPSTTYPNHTASVRNAHEQELAEAAWQSRRPYFTITRSADTIDIHQDDQRVVDQEIRLAAAAGLDYFIFETNPVTPRYNLELYLKSPYRNQIKYALLIPFAAYVDATKFSNFLVSIVDLVKDPSYFRLSSGRPILYLEQLDDYIPGAQAVLVDRINDLRQAVRDKAGGLLPYLVMVDWQSDVRAYPKAKQLGFQARAKYLGKVGGTQAHTNSYLGTLNSDDWKAHAAGGAEYVAGLSYVPTVTVAFDPRPKRPDWGNKPWFEQPTPAELATRVGQAIQWVRANPVASDAKTVLIAAWSDITESGSLLPTLAAGNARLNALSAVLGGHPMAVPTSPFASNPPAPHSIEAISLTPAITPGTHFPKGKAIHLTGEAAVNVRLTVQLGTSVLKTIHEVNSPTTPRAEFNVDLPAPPAGGPYQLKITGDVVPLTVNNIYVD